MWESPPFSKDIRFVSGNDWSLPVITPQPCSGLTFQAYMVPPSGLLPMGVQTAGNVVSLSLPHAITATIPAGVYPWQMSFTDQYGLKTTWFQGNASVLDNA